MNEFQPDVNHFYDVEVARLICQKYGLGEMDALRSYLSSKTYRMFVDERYHMTEFSPPGHL